MYNAIINEVKRIRNDGLSQTDFKRIKKVIWGEYIRSQNDVEDYAHMYLQMKLMGIDYFDFAEVYKTVGFDDIKKRFENHFVPERSALSVVTPVK